MKYIGHEITYKNIDGTESVHLIPQQSYNVRIEYEGPQIVVNGQPIIDPNGNMWVHFENGVSVPYAPLVLERFWVND